MGFHRERQRRPVAAPRSHVRGAASGAVRAGVAVALCGWLSSGALPPTLAAYSLAAPAVADPADLTSGKTVSMDLTGADIHLVVAMLQKQTGAQVLIQDGDQPFKLVNVHLQNASLGVAFRSIATSARATVSLNSDGIYVIRSAGDSSAADNAAPLAPAAPASAPNAAALTSEPLGPRTHLPLSDLHWQKLTLLHAIPNEICRIMHWPMDDTYQASSSIQRLPSYAADVNSEPSVLVNNPQPYQYPSVPIGRGATGPDAANRAPDQQNRSADPASPDQAQQFPGYPGRGGYGGGGYGGGFPNQGGFPGGGFPGQQGGNQPPGANLGGPNIPGQGANGQNTNLPEGVEKIYALQGDNSLLVYGDVNGFNAVKEIVKNLDIAPRQVQIKVEFVTASVSDVDAFGLNFNLVPYPGVEISNDQGNQANLGRQGTPQTYLQIAQGNAVVQLFDSLLKERGKVVQAPLITTTNNVQAVINVVQQIPYQTTSTLLNGQGTGVQSQSTQFLNINTGLAVSPRINSDDTITLNLAPQISDVNGTAINGGPPPTITELLSTLRTVRNGETMVLGGLIRKAETKSQSKIPILGDLPFIGGFFRNHLVNVSDSELLIFVTPTIIGDNTDTPPPTGGGITVSP